MYLVNRIPLKLLQDIKLLVLDVDGVMTDGKFYYSADGHALSSFHVHDGYGMLLLQQSGIDIAVISAGANELVARRLQNLAIKYVYLGSENKFKTFTELLARSKHKAEHTAYLGDDLPDMAVMQAVALPLCVPNARPEVKQIAHYQTQNSGGNGAVREVCDLLLAANG